jgi:hypothetical protein
MCGRVDDCPKMVLYVCQSFLKPMRLVIVREKYSACAHLLALFPGVFSHEVFHCNLQRLRTIPVTQHPERIVKLPQKRWRCRETDPLYSPHTTFLNIW